MESRGRLVENEKRPARLMSGETCGEFQPLGLSAAQDIERLAELEVIESDVGKELERSADGISLGTLPEKRDRLPR